MVLKSPVKLIFLAILAISSPFSTSTVEVQAVNFDFAVTTESQIVFFDSNWNVLTTTISPQFKDLVAITFDESSERIYFNDQLHNDSSIFSLSPSANSDYNNAIEEIVSKKTQHELIQGIAFDELDRTIYWTDAANKKIYRLKQNSTTPSVLFDFSNEGVIPDGIAVDTCRRMLYWTNLNREKPSIERSTLDGQNREVIVQTNLFMPRGIVVDQYTRRLYWVVNQQGTHFTVESSNFDGTDRQIVVEKQNNNPLNLVVTRDSIYWTDFTHRSVWQVPKQNSDNHEPLKVQTFKTRPKGIIWRSYFLSNFENDNECQETIKKIKSLLIKPRSANIDVKEEDKPGKRILCLNKGEYNPTSGSCICNLGFTGERCERDDCHNYCVHGTCSISSIGLPQCICQKGFYGERCQTSKCSDMFCLNGGTCRMDDGNAICECPDPFSGKRCEHNTEICHLLCRFRHADIKLDVFNSCAERCEEYYETPEKLIHSNEILADQYSPPAQNEGNCNTVYNKTIIFGFAGVVVALFLILLIVQSIRRIYKPARPRIKKTFRVQKNISQTPLTSRPLATEQCEITIENCCNMNICETPCFDPKLLQQNLTCTESSTKEDKKVLINNMEEDLY